MSGRPKKKGVSLSMKLSVDVNEMLLKHCEITGQSKTVAVERAIRAYCNDGDESNDTNIVS